MELSEFESYSHKIDQKDVIVSVSDNWASFAHANKASSSCLPENILGSSLWEHINDPETKHLYGIILQKVRLNRQPSTFSFRCDSPDHRRFLELTINPHDDNSIDFKSQINKSEKREPVDLLKSDIERSDGLIRICSMCKKVAISDDRWEEIEIALQELKLFEKELLPGISHGVCPACFDAAMMELDK